MSRFTCKENFCKDPSMVMESTFIFRGVLTAWFENQISTLYVKSSLWKLSSLEVTAETDNTQMHNEERRKDDSISYVEGEKVKKEQAVGITS